MYIQITNTRQIFDNQSTQQKQKPDFNSTSTSHTSSSSTKHINATAGEILLIISICLNRYMHGINNITAVDLSIAYH